MGLDKTFARVSYEVDFRIYNSCKDMDIVDSENGFITGVRPAEEWSFEEFVPHPKRSINDL